MINCYGIDWILHKNVLIPNVAPHKVIKLTLEQETYLLKISGAYFLRYTSSFNDNTGEFWYIIKDSFEDLDKLSSKMRNQIKKSKNNFFTKLLDKDFMINNAYEVYILAISSYNTFEKILTKYEFQNYIQKLDNRYEFWGVFECETEEFVAYSQNLIDDNSCFYEEIFSTPKSLEKYSNYILFFDMNKYYLENKKFSYVHDGSRNLAHETNIHNFLINKFGFRKSYAKIEIRYRKDILVIVRILYLFKNIIYNNNSNLFKKLSVLLKHEEIRKNYE